jgi:hypothetical protein
MNVFSWAPQAILRFGIYSMGFGSISAYVSNKVILDSSSFNRWNIIPLCDTCDEFIMQSAGPRKNAMTMSYSHIFLSTGRMTMNSPSTFVAKSTATKNVFVIQAVGKTDKYASVSEEGEFEFSSFHASEFQFIRV